MACCNNIETIDLGCFICSDEILITAPIDGAYSFKFHFRGGSKTVEINALTGQEIDLSSLLDFELAAPYQYEVTATMPDGSMAKYCFTLESALQC